MTTPASTASQSRKLKEQMNGYENYHQYPEATGSSVVNVGSTERAVSITGGAVMAIVGMRRGGLGGLLAVVSGLGLIHRGITGHCALSSAMRRDSAKPHDVPEPVHVHVAITVNKPRDEVYAFWRELENLPRFMRHLSEVRQTSDRHSSWTATLPGKIGTIEWEAEITRETENEVLAWQSVAHADVDNSGEVRFKDARGGRGTELTCTISYRPPQGYLGVGVARLFNPMFAHIIRDDIRRFREVIEAEEGASIDFRSGGKRPPLRG